MWDFVVSFLPRTGWLLCGVSGTSLGWVAVVGESPVRENTVLVMGVVPE